MIKEPFISPSALIHIRQQLIPNYENMDSQAQNQVNETLIKIIKHGKNKQQLSQISRKCLFDETPLLRSHLWKLLLGVIDGDWTKWQNTRKKNSQLYKSLKDKFFNTYVDQDDLLDFGTKNFDQVLWDQIVLDTKRTHTTLNFFRAPVKFGNIYASKATKHCDILTRILYIWGKTNSTVRYVQGMNQILAPFYYLEFQSIDNQDWDRQSQVFFLFSALMSFIIDMHIKQMDDCQCGIMGRLKTLNKYLRIVDGQLWQKMQKQGIYPQFYSFRWLALFLAQQFQLFETIRLWDYIFSYDGYSRFFYVDSLCVSILLSRKKQIMENDFTTSLPLIQKLKDLQIQNVIKLGTKLFNKYKNVDINKKFDELIANNIKDQQLIKQQRKQIQQKSWSYAQLLKSTGNYLGKWKNWANKDVDKDNK